MPQQISATHTELLNQIEMEHRRLEQNIFMLPEAERTQPGVVGEWSLKDILAHLTAWEQRLLQRVQGQPEAGAGLSTHEFNEQVYQANRTRCWTEVRIAYEQSYEQVLALVKRLPEAELMGWKQHFGWNTYGHYRWAKTQIRQWKRPN